MAAPDRFPRTVAPKRVPRKPGQRAVRPRLASTLILLAGPKDDPHVLMGRRSAGHDFMPGVYVFPGGRVERADSYAPSAGELSERTRFILEAAMTPRRARACALAGIRETWEETGLRLSRPASAKLTPMRGRLWGGFVDGEPGTSHLPDLSGIEVMGRATTPPYRHKRFDTWFFVRWLGGDVPHVEVGDSPELEGVGWHRLSDVADLKTHAMTDVMLGVLARWLEDGEPTWRVPYHRMVRGVFVSGSFPVTGPEG